MASRLVHYARRPFKNIWSLFFVLIIISALYWGLQNRSEGHLTAETGIGYYLGIVGSVIMLTLLLYPLRKRIKPLRNIGKVGNWFKLHMALGIIGPTLILFHANFSLGSLNSTVALTTMLVVVASGIVGRYIYSKIHMGLYGKKAEIRELLFDADAFKQAFGTDVDFAPRIGTEMKAYEQRILSPRRGLLANLWLVLTIGSETRRSRRLVLQESRKVVRFLSARDGWGWRTRRKRMQAVRTHLSSYFAAVRKAAAYSFYEQLFALWHVLHLPLFFLLIAAVVTHVLAVHLF